MSETKSPGPKPTADDLLDEALEESFPASDSISPGAGTGQPIDDHTQTPRKNAKPD